VAGARVGEFAPVAPETRKADPGRAEPVSVLLLAFTVLAAVLMLASWRGAGAAAPAVATALEGQDFVQAPLLRRAIATGIDHALFLPVTMVLVHLLLPSDLQEQVRRGQVDWFDPQITRDVAPVALITQALVSLYCCVAEGAFGRTLGKRLVGLEVRTESASPISWRASVIRNALRVVDEFYLLGLLLILLGPKRQRLGDRLAHTVVVMSKSRQPAGGS